MNRIAVPPAPPKCNFNTSEDFTVFLEIATADGLCVSSVPAAFCHRLHHQKAQPSRHIQIHLKYLPGGKKPAIQGLKRVSTPGLRRYVSYQEIPKVLGGFGVAILSTSKGVLTGRQAREAKAGGEILCTVW